MGRNLDGLSCEQINGGAAAFWIAVTDPVWGNDLLLRGGIRRFVQRMFICTSSIHRILGYTALKFGILSGK
jgi:hypothetical protein